MVEFDVLFAFKYMFRKSRKVWMEFKVLRGLEADIKSGKGKSKVPIWKIGLTVTTLSLH